MKNEPTIDNCGSTTRRVSASAHARRRRGDDPPDRARQLRNEEALRREPVKGDRVSTPTVAADAQDDEVRKGMRTWTAGRSEGPVNE